MVEHSTHIRDVLLYEFESGHPVTEAHRNLSQVFGTEAHSERSVRAWFQRFKAGNKRLEDELRSGRPTAKSFDELKNLVEQHPYEGMRYFAASLGCSVSTSDGNRQRRLDICTQLLSRSRIIDWLDTIVTGDEKWIICINHSRKRAWWAGDEMPDLQFRTAAGQHDGYCRGLLRSTAKTGRQDPQRAPEARQRSPAAR
ncbi:hypothetical protein RB195_018745 [Necator americanus]|uniref:Mos1 transposase HTH domain-containing protein n=1 Tax=Necator americanus TaxID=51031 RepID=A0ABR1CB32_NECAM